jgi:hypothetical protein
LVKLRAATIVNPQLIFGRWQPEERKFAAFSADGGECAVGMLHHNDGNASVSDRTIAWMMYNVTGNLEGGRRLLGRTP